MSTWTSLEMDIYNTFNEEDHFLTGFFNSVYRWLVSKNWQANLNFFYFFLPEELLLWSAFPTYNSRIAGLSHQKSNSSNIGDQREGNKKKTFFKTVTFLHSRKREKISSVSHFLGRQLELVSFSIALAK